jgi:polysaccharide biosynthesis protein PslG
VPTERLKSAIEETLILWAGLLIFGGLAFFFLSTSPVRHWLWNQTGEEDLLPQIKGLTDLAADLARPRLDLAPATALTYAVDNPFGVNVFLEQEADPAKRKLAVQMAAAAGFHWLRQEFPWEDIEIHGKGDFEDRRHEPYRSAWDKYDHIVALAEQEGMELIVRLSNPPAWSRAGGDEVGSYAPPDDFQDFADYVYAVASRYRGQVRYYQLWNEPNIYPEWGNRPVSPEEYTALLKAGAMAVREADPGAVVIAGALAATIDLDGTMTPGHNFNDLLFLQRMYDAGAAPYFDIMAVQGYGLWSGPTDHRMHPRVMNFGRPQFVRDLMVANGDGHKPIWISEMNWNAAPEDVDPRYGRVSLEQQAENLPLAYQRIRQEWPWLGVANVWYLKRATDAWDQARKPEAYFRLLDPDFTPQPVYEAMKRYTQSMNEE